MMTKCRRAFLLILSFLFVFDSFLSMNHTYTIDLVTNQIHQVGCQFLSDNHLSIYSRPRNVTIDEKIGGWRNENTLVKCAAIVLIKEI